MGHYMASMSVATFCFRAVGFLMYVDLDRQRMPNSEVSLCRKLDTRPAIMSRILSFKLESAVETLRTWRA